VIGQAATAGKLGVKGAQYVGKVGRMTGKAAKATVPLAPNRTRDISLNVLNPHFSPDPTKIVGSGNAASVAFEVKLPTSMYPGVSVGKHFQEANTQLLRAMDSDPVFATMMNDLIPGVQGQLTKPRSVSRKSPTDWTWHHATDEGIMQLVPSVQHWDPSLWWMLHPGNRGGMSIWGGGY